MLAAKLATAADLVFTAFDRRVLPISEAVAREWGRLLGASEKNIDDTGIAATALVQRLTVVTRNETDFLHRGVPVLNPFKKPPRLVERRGSPQ